MVLHLNQLSVANMDLLEPKNITIINENGIERNFILSKFPAIQGREIMEQYPFANMPKIGDYKLAQAITLKLMSFVAVNLNGVIQRLDSSLLIDNHANDWITLRKLEDAMIEYNGGFFPNGSISSFLQESIRHHLPKTLKILMASLAQLSQMEKPH